ncbi:putative glucan 1,3-beta-glucosidase [Helianthus annuus]|nr:putative glucan 1,3-beta-glucosidase [Helianthus annuus]
MLLLDTYIAVCRDPRWGRCYESYSEDTKLVQNMTDIILGLQGEIPKGSRLGVPYVAGKLPLSRSFPAKLPLTCFTCFFGLIQFIVIAAVFERDPSNEKSCPGKKVSPSYTPVSFHLAFSYGFNMVHSERWACFCCYVPACADCSCCYYGVCDSS